MVFGQARGKTRSPRWAKARRVVATHLTSRVLVHALQRLGNGLDAARLAFAHHGDSRPMRAAGVMTTGGRPKTTQATSCENCCSLTSQQTAERPRFTGSGAVNSPRSGAFDWGFGFETSIGRNRGSPVEGVGSLGKPRATWTCRLDGERRVWHGNRIASSES